MRTRLVATSIPLFLVLTGAAATISGDSAPRRQFAFVNLVEPTQIGRAIVQGPVVFVHDETRMEQGGPCTFVRAVDPYEGVGEVLAAFRCIPTRRTAPAKFTITTRPNIELGYGCVLIDYQFAGDDEAHGVPSPPALTF